MTSFKLNDQQTGTMGELSAMDRVYVLKGYAGTGKTTVITHWVEAIRKPPEEANKFWRKPSIVLTAPTNKATGVLKEKAEEIKLPVDTSTIHSLLSLKMRWDKGVQILVKDSYGDDQFGDYDYVVIDESSMLGEEMMMYIRDAMDAFPKVKVIFMGDPCQLPPIGERESEAFTESEDISELTEVMRQAGDNTIQGLALYLRELILAGKSTYPSRIFSYVNDKDIFHHPVSGYKDQILQAFADVDSDRDIRHVAWNNRVVDLWNDEIRDKIYGFDRAEWTRGEALVTTAPVLDQAEKFVLFSTDTLLKIQKEPEEVEHFDIPCWKLYTKNRYIYVPRKDIGSLFVDKKKELLDNAKADRTKWRAFYDFMEAFAQVKPAHSLTVHRSQGSTFDDVYCSFANILQNPNRRESLQCLYVAITRPRSRLFLV